MQSLKNLLKRTSRRTSNNVSSQQVVDIEIQMQPRVNPEMEKLEAGMARLQATETVKKTNSVSTRKSGLNRPNKPHRIMVPRGNIHMSQDDTNHLVVIHNARLQEIECMLY
jgi:hypothetical protein